MKQVRAKVLLAIFVAVHLSFYVSALGTDHLQYFFVEGTIQKEKTLDYSQIPNGAQTFFEGGEITGSLERPYPVLINVYHPVTTILLGGVLQLFDLASGFLVYLELKFLLTIHLVILLYRHYADADNFVWGMFIFLTFFIQGVDIGCGQYHFLLNYFVFLFLFGLIQSKPTWLLSCSYFASLMIKPIGLLWIPQLLMVRRYRIVAWSVGAFFLVTVAGWWIPGGQFYLQELFHHSTTHIERVSEGIPTDGGRYTLETIIRFLGASPLAAQAVKFSMPIAILWVCYHCRIALFPALFLWTCYYLLWYSRVYIYHYTTLIPFFTLGVLTQPAFQGRFVKAMMLLSCLPSPYLLYKLTGVFVEGPVEGPHQTVTAEGFFTMICLRVVPVLLIALSIMTDSCRQTTSHGRGHSTEGTVSA